MKTIKAIVRLIATLVLIVLFVVKQGWVIQNYHILITIPGFIPVLAILSILMLLVIILLMLPSRVLKKLEDKLGIPFDD